MTNQQQEVDNNELDDLAFLSDLDDMMESKDSEESSETDILAAIDDIQSEEEMAEIYESQEDSVTDSAALSDSIQVSGEAEEEDVAEEVKPAVVKAAASKSEKIKARMGADVQDMMMLSPSWAGLSDEDRELEFTKIIDGMAKYVGDKAVNLFSFLKTGSGLNVVTARTFDVFLKDKQIVGGKDGNIVQNLLLKPYSLGTANSQANQMLQLFTFLEIGKRAARGTVVVNEDSIILERVEAILSK